MPVDHIRYDILVQDALRGMVREVLAETIKKGLPGEHHFFITFDTRADGVRLSDRLRAQYPDEMTVVLQHQFWDLKVTDETFEVGLSFGGIGERLVIPFAAIRAFADPSVQFTLQFETLDDTPEDQAGAPAGPERDRGAATARNKRRLPARRDDATPAAAERGASRPSPQTPRSDAAAAPREAPDKPQDDSSGKAGAEVVRLDRFRKK
ncbi:MAG TPA: ClpXP protease specificity-enhancing factor SspB [Xanthobacteraceae bacterium]|nr:ClpXP protease specificity-enhancing factor SspB [Xanthobacteraceae bacterium]